MFFSECGTNQLSLLLITLFSVTFPLWTNQRPRKCDMTEIQKDIQTYRKTYTHLDIMTTNTLREAAIKIKFDLLNEQIKFSYQLMLLMLLLVVIYYCTSTSQQIQVKIFCSKNKFLHTNCSCICGHCIQVTHYVFDIYKLILLIFNLIFVTIMACYM